MTPSNIICVSQEGPANALALNKDNTQVVIAGRNVFKVFAIGESEFSEVCNLRVGKNLNLNFSSIDVAWSAIEENTLATAATNGAVVVWNLSRSGRSKQEHVFSDHKRTVNKVSFHLTEPSLLISGSQDGMMKCFDLRIKEVARTFISNTESIRDVQFSPQQPNSFAAVSENGSVQLWDVRRHDRCIQQFTAHSGPVFACDWHPEMPWLATASRDKTIKVWDINTRALEHTIHTIAAVGHVKWRPHKKWQVSGCALVLDCAVHVWDVRRPQLPLASFSPHRDVTTALAWLQPGAALACSRDCNLYRHSWHEAAHPVLWGAAHAAALGARGTLAHAAPARPLPPLARSDPPPYLHHHTRKQPTAGSLTPAAQAALERAFPGNASSTLARHVLPAGAGGGGGAGDVFVGCARRYKLQGAAPDQLCRHNAQVARDHHRHMVAHVWEIIRLWLTSRVSSRARASPPAPPPAPPAAPPPRAPPAPPRDEPWSDAHFNNSGVLGMPTHTIYIPHQPTDDESGWVSAASAHYVDVEAVDWALPEEAFPLRAAPPAPPAAPCALPAAATAAAAAANDKNLDIMRDTQMSSCMAGGECGGAGGGGGGAGGGGGGASPGGSSAGSTDRSPTLQHHASLTSSVYCAGGGGATGAGAAGAGSAAAGWARPPLAPLLAAALRQHADLGDVQTPATVLLALGDLRAELCSYVEESLQEHWLLGYIELLQRHKLWNVATEVIGVSWVSMVWALSQQSVCISMVCAGCGRRAPRAPRAPRDPRAAAPPPRACDACAPRDHHAQLCAVCHRVVRGLFAWCQGCSHGGHLQHMQRWLQQHALCPAGCGHRCQLG